MLMAFGYFSSTFALEGVNVGVSLLYGKFEADGAKEVFSGDHVSGASADTVTKNASADGDEAEGDFAIGSLFVEKTLGDKFSIGIDYVPMSMETETTENIQSQLSSGSTRSNKTNTVQVDFSDLVTLYGTINLNDNIYVKAGMMEIDVETNEKLATGGSYGNTTLDGVVLGIGYNRTLDNGAFVRLEANHMDFDGVTLTNSDDSTKSVTADGISGYGARLSIGKSF